MREFIIADNQDITKAGMMFLLSKQKDTCLLYTSNYSQQEYMCGNDYSLTYYNNDKRQWETLPTDPIIEDIAWILDLSLIHIFR